MNKEDVIKILKLLKECPIKSWHDLDEDATQDDVWEAQAEWIKSRM